MSSVTGDLLLYRASDGAVRAEVRYENDSVWLTQAQMAELFGVQVPAISKHLKNIHDSGELSRSATLSRMETVQREGGRDVKREVDFYNLDASISVSYRVNSTQATQFRIWATETLREFIVKCFVLDDERLKLNTRFGPDYFDELLERIREIRQIPMKMADWVQKLDAFLSFNEYEVLTNAGSVSAAVAKQLAEEQYAQFRVTQDRAFTSDFEKEAKRISGGRKARGEKR